MVRGRNRSWRRRGSLLIMSLILSTILFCAAMEAAPLWGRVVDRSLAQERAYRVQRLNEGIARYTARNGHGPADLGALVSDVSGPFVPRIYTDPLTESRTWQCLRSPAGSILSVR